jgi:hypothetical protein
MKDSVRRKDSKFEQQLKAELKMIGSNLKKFAAEENRQM